MKKGTAASIHMDHYKEIRNGGQEWYKTSSSEQWGDEGGSDQQRECSKEVGKTEGKG